MRRIIAGFVCMLLIFGIIPSAFAQEIISSAEGGRIIRIDAENGLSYCADFYKACVRTLRREGETLIMEFDVGHIELTDFYSHGRDARILSFSDGTFITGNDFDSNGMYTGTVQSGAESLKKNQELRMESFENPQGNVDYTVRVDFGGVNVVQNDAAIYGEAKQRCLAKLHEVCGEESEYRSEGSTISLSLKENEDMSLTAVKEVVETADGYTVTCLKPECVSIRSASELRAISEGRTAVIFTNSLGETLARMQVKVSEENGELLLSCLCPCCGEESAGMLHLLPCGDYFCMDGYEPIEHVQAQCGIAGHCSTSDAEHGICDNCREFLCNGKLHGFGHCEHKHEWYITGYMNPTATTDGYSRSACISCGAVYTQILPAYGAG